MREEDIITGCKAKNRKAQKALVDGYSSYLYGVCVRYTVDKAFAKDCLQESLLRIMNKIDLYTEKGKFKSWMAQVTAMKCLEMLRKEKKYRSVEIIDQYKIDDGQQIFSKMHKESVMKFMSTLPSNNRVALNMYLVEGYSHREIAKKLGVTESSSRSLVARGRKMIQTAFAENIHTPPLRKVQ